MDPNCSCSKSDLRKRKRSNEDGADCVGVSPVRLKSEYKRPRRTSHASLQLSNASSRKQQGVLTPLSSQSPPSPQTPTPSVPLTNHATDPLTKEQIVSINGDLEADQPSSLQVQKEVTPISPQNAPHAAPATSIAQEHLRSTSAGLESTPSPQTPFEFVWEGYYDPEFGKKVSDAYVGSRWRQSARVYKYGREVAEEWKRGSTPEEAREKWRQKLEEQERDWAEITESEPEDDLPPAEQKTQEGEVIPYPAQEAVPVL
ncbi:MAG: hypothetical protein Q9219_002636 [cf. Caloplaca sp. 3 TL-2023]